MHRRGLGAVVLLVLLASSMTADLVLADKLNRDYVIYEVTIDNYPDNRPVKPPDDNSLTLIEGETEPGAPVTVIVHSEPLVLETFADSKGHFEVEIENLAEGSHSVDAVAGDNNRNGIADGPQEGGWRGYEERAGRNNIELGEYTFFNLPLDYDPFRLELSDRRDIISRGWSRSGSSWVEVSSDSPIVKSWSHYDTLNLDQSYERSEYDWAEGWKVSKITEKHDVTYDRTRCGWSQTDTEGWKKVSKTAFKNTQKGEKVTEDERSKVTLYVYAFDKLPLDGKHDTVLQTQNDYGDKWNTRGGVGYNVESYTYLEGSAERTYVSKDEGRGVIDTDYRYSRTRYDKKWKYRHTGFGGVDEIRWYDTEQESDSYNDYDLLDTRRDKIELEDYVDEIDRGNSYRIYSRTDGDQYTQYTLEGYEHDYGTVYKVKESFYEWESLASGDETGNYETLTGYDVNRAKFIRSTQYVKRASYAKDGWEDEQTNVIVMPRNNYGDDIRLYADRSFASLSDDVVTPHSPAISKLTVSPPDYLSDGSNSVKLIGHTSETALETWSAENFYLLDLQTDDKPDGILDAWSESETWMAPNPLTEVSLDVQAKTIDGDYYSAKIWVDESFQGTTPEYIGSLDPGNHKVKFEESRGQYEFSHVVVDGENRGKVNPVEVETPVGSSRTIIGYYKLLKPPEPKYPIQKAKKGMFFPASSSGIVKTYWARKNAGHIESFGELWSVNSVPGTALESFWSPDQVAKMRDKWKKDDSVDWVFMEMDDKSLTKKDFWLVDGNLVGDFWPTMQMAWEEACDHANSDPDTASIHYHPD